MRLLLTGVFVLTLLGAGIESPMAGEIYRWVDADGIIHVSDTPPPRGTAGAVEQYEGSDAAPSSTAPAAKPAETKNRPPRVDLYTTQWCGYCKKAKAFFKQLGIAYTEYDIEKDPAAARRRNTLAPGRGVPVAVINGTHIVGYDPNAYRRALKLP